jgi:hypothetical protein
MTRKDSASRRLAKAFSIVVPDTALALVAVDDEKPPHIIKWENMDDGPSVASAYRNIFTLTSDPGDALLAMVFAAAKLNSNDPTHWRVLLEFFAWAHYGDRRKRGAPKNGIHYAFHSLSATITTPNYAIPTGRTTTYSEVYAGRRKPIRPNGDPYRRIG